MTNAIGCDILIHVETRACWNWQTGTFEGRVFMTCGFKSHCSHQFYRMPNIWFIYLVCDFYFVRKNFNTFAGMAELADAHGSGPCEGNFMQVQVLLPAPRRSKVHFASTFLCKKPSARFLASPLSQKVTLGLPVRL